MAMKRGNNHERTKSHLADRSLRTDNDAPQNEQATRAFASHNLTLSLLISLSWGALLFIFATPIISIYELEPHIAKMAGEYLRIIATAFPFVFLSAAFTGIFNAAGRSKIPFSINGIGLITNMILDPLFIFGLNWGTTGAAIATWLAEATVCILFIYQLKQKKILWDDFRLFTTLKKQYTHHILKIGLPVAVLNTLFEAARKYHPKRQRARFRASEAATRR